MQAALLGSIAAAPAPAGPWTPTDVPNLWAWLKVADATPSLWPDQSGNSRNAVQASAPSQPTVLATRVEFAGSEEMTIADILPTPVTIYCRARTGANPTTIQTAIGQASAGGIGIALDLASGVTFTDARGRVRTTVEGLASNTIVGPQSRSYTSKLEEQASGATFWVELGAPSPPAPVALSWATGAPQTRTGPIRLGQGLDDAGSPVGGSLTALEEIIIVAGIPAASDDTKIINWMYQPSEAATAFSDGEFWDDGKGWVT